MKTIRVDNCLLKEGDRIALVDIGGNIRYFALGDEYSNWLTDINVPMRGFYIGDPTVTSPRRIILLNSDYSDKVVPELTTQQKYTALLAGLKADASNPVSRQLLTEIGEV